MTWFKAAMCSGMDPEKFTVRTVPVPNGPIWKAAQEVCAGCPVVAECADDALLHRDTGVIRAGIPLRFGGQQYEDDRRALAAAAHHSRQGRRKRA